jgi:thiol-disulfide isomerase/thioredoxin
MKSHHENDTTILLGLLFAPPPSAEFRTWTRNDGKTAELELISVTDADGEKSGEFKMRNGQIGGDQGIGPQRGRCETACEWKPAAAEPQPSQRLRRNPRRQSGQTRRQVAQVLQGSEKPEKYYVFYYTASWCGPCQQVHALAGGLLRKKQNGNFELVLITSDSDEDAWRATPRKKMPWPQLKLKKAADFKKEFKHGVTGIPSVIVATSKARCLGNYRDLARARETRQITMSRSPLEENIASHETPGSKFFPPFEVTPELEAEADERISHYPANKPPSAAPHRAAQVLLHHRKLDLSTRSSRSTPVSAISGKFHIRVCASRWAAHTN